MNLGKSPQKLEQIYTSESLDQENSQDLGRRDIEEQKQQNISNDDKDVHIDRKEMQQINQRIEVYNRNKVKQSPLAFEMDPENNPQHGSSNTCNEHSSSRNQQQQSPLDSSNKKIKCLIIVLMLCGLTFLMYYAVKLFLSIQNQGLEAQDFSIKDPKFEYHFQFKYLQTESNQDKKSDFKFNYNPTYLALYDANNQIFKEGALLTSGNKPSESIITFTHIQQEVMNLKFDNIKKENIILDQLPENITVNNPRVVYRKSQKTYYLIYNQINHTDQYYAYRGENFQEKYLPVTQIMLATCKENTFKPDKWEFQKEEKFLIKASSQNFKNYDIDTLLNYVVFGGFPFLQGNQSTQFQLKNIRDGVLLFRDESNQPPILFWGIKDIYMATAINLTGMTFMTNNNIFLKNRIGFFDSLLVTVGPHPVRISNNNYLMIYNSVEQEDQINEDGNIIYKYNIGYCILDGNNPQTILQRSDKPLISATDEITLLNGVQQKIIIANGLKELGKDVFVLYYQNASRFLDAVQLQIKISEKNDNNNNNFNQTFIQITKLF